MGTRWRGLLAPIDTPTGDNPPRRIHEFTRRGLPLPHRWQREDETGHDRSVVVGLTDAMAFLTVADAVEQGWISAETARTLRPDMRGVFATGEFFDDVDSTVMPRLAQDAAEARFLAEKGVLGPSVGAGEAEMYGLVHAGTRDRVTDAEAAAAEAEGRRLDTEALFDSYEIAESTLVPVPAFGETSAPFEIITDRQATDLALTAAVSGAVDLLPVAGRDMEWDGDAAKRRVFEACTDGDTVDVDCVARAFLWRDPDADPQTQAAYKLGFADFVDGELRIVPRGVAATAGGRGVDAADIPAGDKARVKTRICALYGRVRAEHDDWPDCPFHDDGMMAAIVAAASTQAQVYPADVFVVEPGDRVVPLTVEPRRDGEDFHRVHGYAARFGTCHTGIRNVCTTAPQTRTGYALFHRYPLDTTEGLLAAGRITTGFGRTGTGCTHPGCRGKDDHACDQMSLAETIAHYDRHKTLAYVRATETPRGIWLSGVTADAELSDADRQVLSRRKMSGDWRPHADGFEMVEVLALAKEEPGFPVTLHRGRQTALLAAGAVVPDDDETSTSDVDETASAGELDLAARVADMVVTQLRHEGLVPTATALTAADEPHTGAMVALVPTAEDAKRLAVPGGLDPDDLHVTLLYLGDADQIPPDARERVVEMLRDWVEHELRPDYGGVPVEADGFAVSMFNPPSQFAHDKGRDSCVVLGLSGPDLELVKEMAESTVAAVNDVDIPEQHTPWQPHVTLVYTDNTDAVGGYTDRVGPVEFDRLRVAFGGDVVDIPITGDVDDEEQDGPEEEPYGGSENAEMANQAAMLAAGIEAGFAADEAAALLADIDTTFHLPGRHNQADHGRRRAKPSIPRIRARNSKAAEPLRDAEANAYERDGLAGLERFAASTRAVGHLRNAARDLKDGDAPSVVADRLRQMADDDLGEHGEPLSPDEARLPGRVEPGKDDLREMARADAGLLRRAADAIEETAERPGKRNGQVPSRIAAALAHIPRRGILDIRPFENLTDVDIDALTPEQRTEIVKRIRRNLDDAWPTEAVLTSGDRYDKYRGELARAAEAIRRIERLKTQVSLASLPSGRDAFRYLTPAQHQELERRLTDGESGLEVAEAFRAMAHGSTGFVTAARRDAAKAMEAYRDAEARPLGDPADDARVEELYRVAQKKAQEAEAAEAAAASLVTALVQFDPVGAGR